MAQPMTGYGVLFAVVFVAGLAYGGSWIVEQLRPRREAPRVVTPKRVAPTHLDVWRRRYVHGEITLEAFERGVAELLRDGRIDTVAPVPVGSPITRRARRYTIDAGDGETVEVTTFRAPA